VHTQEKKKGRKKKVVISRDVIAFLLSLTYLFVLNFLGQNSCQKICTSVFRSSQAAICRFSSCVSYGGRSKFACSIMPLQPDVYPTCQSNSDTAASGIFKMFQDEATLVHGEKVHSILEEIGIEDDETMFAVLTMDDERLNGMLREAKRLNLVEKFSVIQAMRNFGNDHKIAR
jgi:hypothetical protein